MRYFLAAPCADVLMGAGGKRQRLLGGAVGSLGNLGGGGAPPETSQKWEAGAGVCAAEVGSWKGHQSRGRVRLWRALVCSRVSNKRSISIGCCSVISGAEATENGGQIRVLLGRPLRLSWLPAPSGRPSVGAQIHHADISFLTFTPLLKTFCQGYALGFRPLWGPSESVW